jgi:hypothetical protein
MRDMKELEPFNNKTTKNYPLFHYPELSASRLEMVPTITNFTVHGKVARFNSLPLSFAPKTVGNFAAILLARWLIRNLMR